MHNPDNLEPPVFGYPGDTSRTYDATPTSHIRSAADDRR
jgi:hypothetical protein